MELVRYFMDSTSLWLSPAQAINGLYFRYKERILLFGFFASIIGNIARIVANMAVSSVVPTALVSYFIAGVAKSLLWNYILLFAVLSVTSFLLGLAKKSFVATELLGLFLSTEFVWLLLLPLAVIFSALPAGFSFLYGFCSFALFILSVFLKVRAVALATRTNDSAVFGYLLAPIGVIVIYAGVALIYFIIWIKNILM